MTTMETERTMPRVNTVEERRAAPIGTRLHVTDRPGSVWRKVAENEWQAEYDSARARIRTDDTGRSGWYANPHAGSYTVIEYPTTEQPTERPVATGVVRDYAALVALSEGTEFWNTEAPQVRWQMRADSAAVLVDDPVQVLVALSTFEGPANAGHFSYRSVTERYVPTVGHTLATAEEFNACPEGTTINWRGVHDRVKRDDDLWYLDGRAGGDPTGAGSLTVGEWVVTFVPGSDTTVVTSDEAVITISAHERALGQERQMAHDQAIRDRNEEFLTALRDNWDGHSFNEDEINQVLDDLGLPNIVVREDVTVTVTVEGRSELSESDVRGCFEGDYYATIDDTVTVDWTIDDITFEISDVENGACACDQVDREMVEDNLSEHSVAWESFTFDKTCENCE